MCNLSVEGSVFSGSAWGHPSSTLIIFCNLLSTEYHAHLSIFLLFTFNLLYLSHLGECLLEGGGDGAVDEEVGGDVEHDEQVGDGLEAHHPEGGDVLVVLPDAGHLRRDEHDDHDDHYDHDDQGDKYS